MEFDEEGLKKYGFNKSTKITNLLNNNWSDIFENKEEELTKGVYIIIRKTDKELEIEDFNSLRYFYIKKGNRKKMKFYSKGELYQKWKNQTNKNILYIGKASNKKGLKQRLKYYIDFGKIARKGNEFQEIENPKTHRGGRALWQLNDLNEVYVLWKKSENPREEEEKLILNFKKQNKENRPLANMSD